MSAGSGTTILPPTHNGTYTAHQPRASVTVIAWGMLSAPPPLSALGTFVLGSSARGLKVDYRSVWNFIHAEKLKLQKKPGRQRARFARAT